MTAGIEGRPARHRSSVIALFVAVSGVLVPAQQQAPAPDSQDSVAVFRTGIEAVQIHAYVTDADGTPVTDLTADDFEIFEAGVPRSVDTFTLVNIPIERPLGRANTWPVAADVATNDGPEGRIYLFLLDEIRQDLALRTRAFLRRFLENHFGPNDLAAVSLSGRGLASSGYGFSSNPRLLLDAVDRFSGGFPDMAAGCESQQRFLARGGDRMSQSLPFEQWAQVESRIESLRRATEMMAALPGGRKVILFFAECIGHDMFEVRDYHGGVLSRLGDDAQAAMAAATRGNVVVYPVDPGGLTPGMGGLQGLGIRADMTALGELTAGFALTNSNNFSQAFERIVREHSTYYVLGFNSAYERRDGRFVNVEVRVKRPGLQVRSGSGYVAPLGPRRPDTRTVAGSAAAALATPIGTRGLPLRVAAAPFKGTDGDAAVALVVEVGAWDLPLVERDGRRQARVEVSYVPIDASGRAYTGGVHALTLTETPDGEPRPGEQWLRVVSQLALPAGQYQIRVSAATGPRTGSVLYDLEVPEFGRQPLELSGIALTAVSVVGTATLRPALPATAADSSTRCRPPTCVVPLSIDAAPNGEDPLVDALPAQPTTRRTFDRTDTLALFAEVYERREAPEHRITLAVELQGDEGQRIPLAAATRLSTDPRRPSGGHGFTLELPLREVPPGRYMLYLEAHSATGRSATATRALPIEVQ